MTKETGTNRNRRLARLVFSFSLLVPAFWLAAQRLNVYRVAWVGALFELLWLPMILILFALPVVSFVFWRKQRYSIRSIYFYSLLISVVALLFIVSKG